MEVNKTNSTPASAPIGGNNKNPAAFDITTLMSPPDPVPLDTFNNSITVASAPAKMSSLTRDGQESRPRMPMSPPVSPPVKVVTSANAEPGSPAVKDPILYPRDEAPPSPPQHPLFPATESMQHRRLVDEHIAHRDITLFRKFSPPRPEEYELALQVKSQVMKMFSKDRRSWMEKERLQLVMDRSLNRDRWNNKRYTVIAPAKTAKIPVKIQAPKRTPTTKPDRVVKPSQARSTPASRPPRANQTSSKNNRNASTTPEPGRRVVAPNREDRDFNALEDLCPPLSSLPDKSNSLKVDWKGAPVDLTNDPHAHLLHPDELLLAANLRLDCATYLTSKRRIFLRRRDCARTGKEFRKTDAQQACKIDVNKASKLWTAFEKVGWLDIRWMAGRY